MASDEDIEKLTICSGWDGTSVPATLVQLTMAAFLFACRTGMRSGEILNLDEAWIDGNVIHLPKEVTKTNTKRDVALSKEALRILDLVRERGCHPFIFGDLSAATKDVLWRRIRDRAGLGPVVDSRGIVIREGLNFHDSRATFATWAASPDPATGAPRLEVMALARQTGPSLSKYFLIANQEGTEKINGHPDFDYNEDSVKVLKSPKGTTFVIPNTGGTKAYDAIYGYSLEHIKAVRPKLSWLTQAQLEHDDYLFEKGWQPHRSERFKTKHENWRDSSKQNFVVYRITGDRPTGEVYQVSGDLIKGEQRRVTIVDRFEIRK